MLKFHNIEYDERHEIMPLQTNLWVMFGMILARLLNDAGVKVLVLEQKTKVHIQPETFGTFTSAAAEHGLEGYIDHYFDTFTFYGPSTKASATERDNMCLVKSELSQESGAEKCLYQDKYPSYSPAEKESIHENPLRRLLSAAGCRGLPVGWR